GSLVVVGSSGLVRVHVHTNTPETAIQAASELGDVQDTKIDDMREQHREFIRTVGTGHAGETLAAEGSLADEPGRQTRRRASGDRRLRRVRIVTDSTADLPPGLADDLGITVVPLRVHFEDGSFRDGVDLTNKQFYEKLEASAGLPTTSQPTPHEFIEVYERLSWETKTVLSIHISSAMSGTMQSARSAGGAVDGVQVLAVDSHLTSAPLGMVVVEAARAAQEAAQLPELATLVSNLSVRARVFFTVGSLDYLVRGGRIGRCKALIGKLARLKPILTIADGVVTPAGKARGDDGVLEALLELAAPELEGGTGGTLGVLHAQRPDIPGKVEAAFRERFGFDEMQVSELGSIVGTHTGPGTWGVSYFARRRVARP
ncbi:MAG: DegV family protein, partial [Gemmatimonadota bacterium]